MLKLVVLNELGSSALIDYKTFAYSDLYLDRHQNCLEYLLDILNQSRYEEALVFFTSKEFLISSFEFLSDGGIILTGTEVYEMINDAYPNSLRKQRCPFLGTCYRLELHGRGIC